MNPAVEAAVARVTRNKKNAWAAELYRIVATEGPVNREQTLLRVAPLVPGEQALRYSERERVSSLGKRKRKGLPTTREDGARMIHRDPGWALLRAQRRVAAASLWDHVRNKLVVENEDGTLSLAKDPREGQLKRWTPWTAAMRAALAEAGEADKEALLQAGMPHVDRVRAIQAARHARERERRKRAARGATRVGPRAVDDDDRDFRIGARLLAHDGLVTLVKSGWAQREGDVFRFLPWPSEEERRNGSG